MAVSSVFAQYLVKGLGCERPSPARPVREGGCVHFLPPHVNNNTVLFTFLCTACFFIFAELSVKGP